jgi:8-oxo-dGTP diphosphatase
MTTDLPFPRVGVAVIIIRNGQLLLIRRANLHGMGTWAVPGGHLEFGETPEQCAVRETREEVGIEIDRVRFIGATNDIFQESGRHYVTLWMRGEWIAGKPVIAAQAELDAVDWFDLDNLPQPFFLPMENLVNGNSLPPDAFKNVKSDR